ncbi:DUF3012 domain-containing protein [Shewanella sp. KT0246]|uniref:DUF3012 domain-containing protein n=1 Tax=Shewanella sp. KT0246 TaxID=2815912 RepID=UPI001BBA9495|nr:DUF3012 domain-containing protein [Shewanella sp. KT0246]GIU50456.1 DUF3012 domain-containing protein [Shewanella sp. KT0246]
MSIKTSVSKVSIKVAALISAGVLVLGLTACAPEVGSEAWCKQMKEKPSGDWSSNEAADYAKHCLF